MQPSTLRIAPYLAQRAHWPAHGRHILAQYDESSIIVYQAYNRAIGEFAIEHQYLGGAFSLGRMSWIKPNFLWMMYRSGWGTKSAQEVVLAIRMVRAGFEQILAQAVFSSFQPGLHEDRAVWKGQLASSEVRLQWDPDHAPSGAREERRAVQLGLRGETLRRYAREWIIEIIDMRAFVAAQRAQVCDLDALMVPAEQVYPVTDPDTVRAVQLDRAL
ncbi:MAG: DUF4291 domain-containing protein [Myxococcota bacterium]